MAKSFDLKSSADRSELGQWLKSHSEAEFQNYFEYSISDEAKNNFNYDERNNLLLMKKFLNSYDELTHNQLNSIKWAYGIVERINDIKYTKEQAENVINEEDLSLPLRHFTLRVAWHDNMWNGHVCKDPENNISCNGYHSLLSDRIRREKERLLNLEKKYAGHPISDMFNDKDHKGEVPPCYWSINIFGKDTIPIKHINPAASKVLTPIPEDLKPNSMFSWPFGISFVREYEDYKTNGKYWGNFDSVRVPRFRNKIKPGKSIGFIYAKFSNPLSYEDFKYLIVGCGIISDKGLKSKFGPKTEITKIQQKGYTKDLRNFPETNWVIQYNFDPNSLVRIPYHEYIEEAKRRSLNSDESEKLLSNIKVTIDEPELEHCFKFVNMDIDDDEAIYILSKIRNKLIDAKNIWIPNDYSFDENIEKTDKLIEYCWNRRTHFPGFANLSRSIMYLEENEKCCLDNFIEEVKENEENYCDKVKELILNPNCDVKYKSFKGKLNQLKEDLETKEIDIDHFLTLSMLNLSKYQFDKIINDKIEGTKKELTDFCKNLYLLFEEYTPDENPQDKITGDFQDYPIELFKIDIALFPNQDYLSKNFLQNEYKITDERRIRSLVIQYLKSLENKTGDCFDEAKNIQAYVENFPLFYKSQNASLKLPSLFFEKRNAEYDKHLDKKIEIVEANDKKYYYLKEVYNAELIIKDFILKLLKTEQKNTLTYHSLGNYIKTSVEILKTRIGNNFDKEQFVIERQHLYDNLFPNRFHLLIGNPGSGKSFEILNIIKYFIENNESYILLTPTGKAALRLKSDDNFKEAGITAMTIDKFIKQWNYDKDSRINYNNIIIDEMSMIDLMKLNSLLGFFEADKPSLHRLIMVGDLNQLPPIGFGKPFYDIINFVKSNSEYISHITELEVNCRQEMEGNEVLNFSKYFTNEIDLLPEQIKKIESGGEISRGFYIKYWKNERELEVILKEELDNLSKDKTISDLEKLNSLFNICPNKSIEEQIINVDNFQVITPYRSYSDKINNYYQSKIKLGLDINILKLFKDKDKIIRTQNLYRKNDLVLSNGSIGIAFDNDNGGTLYFSELDNKFIKTRGENGIYNNQKEYFELAYCITVHKSQGSGFDHLIVVIPRKYGILCKELIYTALTRSKKSIVILVEGESGECFDKSLFEYARKRVFTENRKTSLMQDSPYLHYGLEPEPNVFVQSRVEQIIYMRLMQFRKEENDTNKFDFAYEKYPVVKGKELRIKTDFTIYLKGNTYYWEHLGLITKNYYKKQWLELKLKTYKENGLLDNLITTDELKGINPAKIDDIIENIILDNLGTEDKYNKYSNHHFSLR
jgi:exodeoxyribonuclease V alpha subunit